MNEKWYVAAKKADFQAIAKKFGIDPVTARIIRNRNVVGDGRSFVIRHSFWAEWKPRLF